jgi:hypothetical protein
MNAAPVAILTRPIAAADCAPRGTVAKAAAVKATDSTVTMIDGLSLVIC